MSKAYYLEIKGVDKLFRNLELLNLYSNEGMRLGLLYTAPKLMELAKKAAPVGPPRPHDPTHVKIRDSFKISDIEESKTSINTPVIIPSLNPYVANFKFSYYDGLVKIMNTAPHARFVEFGTHGTQIGTLPGRGGGKEPVYRITSKRRMVFYDARRRRWVSKYAVRGQKPQPFMSKACSPRALGLALETFYQTVSTSIFTKPLFPI